MLRDVEATHDETDLDVTGVTAFGDIGGIGDIGDIGDFGDIDVCD